MTTVLFVAAISLAVLSLGSRRWRRARLRKAAHQRAGATRDRAIPIRSYAEMEDHVAGRWCHCGGYLERAGEGSSESGDRRYRTVNLRCQECDDVHRVFFDTTDILH